jgi:23S rRNA pseudouridine1911/1915/1917 synthase
MMEHPDLEDIKDESDDLFEHFRMVADPGQSLLRIDKFLVNHMRHVSRSRVQTAADNGFIRVNDVAVKSNYRVKPGDVITLVLANPPREFELLPEAIPLNIVYEDDALMIIDKPAGLVVHPGVGNWTGTLVNGLLHHFQGLPNNHGEARPGLVHRIDKDTSGLLVIAKTELAMTHLARQFFEKTTGRTYLALVWGDVASESGTVEGNIGRDPRDRKRQAIFVDGSQGKPAITHYQVVERFGPVTLIACTLETGRTHQIRVHMKSLGHPLFADATYGGDEILRGSPTAKYKQFARNTLDALGRQALHAASLALDHPTSGKRLSFEAPLPADMAHTLERWRNYRDNNQQMLD